MSWTVNCGHHPVAAVICLIQSYTGSGHGRPASFPGRPAASRIPGVARENVLGGPSPLMRLVVQTGRLPRLESPDPRDPLGLRGDAPLLDAWLTFTERAEAGELPPMGAPGPQHRQALVGSGGAGEAPPPDRLAPRDTAAPLPVT